METSFHCSKFWHIFFAHQWLCCRKKEVHKIGLAVMDGLFLACFRLAIFPKSSSSYFEPYRVYSRSITESSSLTVLYISYSQWEPIWSTRVGWGWHIWREPQIGSNSSHTTLYGSLCDLHNPDLVFISFILWLWLWPTKGWEWLLWNFHSMHFHCFSPSTSGCLIPHFSIPLVKSNLLQQAYLLTLLTALCNAAFLIGYAKTPYVEAGISTCGSQTWLYHS